MSKKINYTFGKITQLGSEQSFNTDAIIDFPIVEGHVFLVCDGHNGEEGHGALAAKLTAESIKKYFYNKSYKDMLSALTNAVSFANYAVNSQAHKDPKYRNIGSTLAILIFKSQKIYYAYAGDSRIYLYKNEQLKALTLDHVEDRYNPSTSEVNVLIGKNKDIKFGVCKSPLQVSADDYFLLCTDGLSDVLDNQEISSIIADKDTSPDHKALLLAQKVEEKQGKDNISAYVLEFSDKVIQEKPQATKKNMKILLFAVLGLMIVFGVVFAINFFKTDKHQEKNQVQVASEKEEIFATEDLLMEDTVSEKIPEQIQAEPEKEEELKVQKVQAMQEKIVNKTEAVFFQHKIQYGENLYRISLRYGVSQQKIIDLNGELVKKFIAGKKIKIPVKAIHIVKKGESYSILSDKYKVKIADICRANQSDKNQSLSEGVKMVIPFR